jgi:hemerythrin-like domain-containing protein
MHHHPKEDIVLRRLRQRAPDLDAEFFGLEAEHEDLSDKLQSFSRAVVALFIDPSPMTRADFIKSVRCFIEHERKHMAIEERFFFPAAEKWLTEEDWIEIDEAVSHFVDPLSAPDAGLRYYSLREKLEWWRGDEVA